VEYLIPAYPSRAGAKHDLFSPTSKTSRMRDYAAWSENRAAWTSSRA